MPLTGAIKNQITGQIDLIFDAIAAGTAFDTNEWIHTSFNFTAGGFTYNVLCLPEGDIAHPRVMVQIQKV